MSEDVAAGDKAETPSSWGADLRGYERQKRHEIHPGLLAGPTVRMDSGGLARAERAFNPLLQKYLEPDRESELQGLEDRERVAHLNRARDLQLRREQGHNIVTHVDRQAPDLTGAREMIVPFADPDTAPIPTTCVDYNLISNLPLDEHHWAAPGSRPRFKHRDPKPRKVKRDQVRDFNVLSNRYITDHEAKTERDNALNLLEATKKFKMTNTFAPLLQKCNDPSSEAQVRAFEDMHAAMTEMRAELVEPPSNLGRESQFWDMVTHQVKNADMLQKISAAEEGRKVRYKSRYEAEKVQKAVDIVFEDAEIQQRAERVAPERFFEQVSHGYNIVTNREFGEGPKCQKMYIPPHFVPKLSQWDKVHKDLDDLEPQSARAAPVSRHRTTPSAKAPSSARGSGASCGSSRGREKTSGLMKIGVQALSSVSSSGAPPAPEIPGTPSGSVYSRQKGI